MNLGITNTGIRIKLILDTTVTIPNKGNKNTFNLSLW